MIIFYAFMYSSLMFGQIGFLSEFHGTLYTFKILDLFMHICDVSFQQTWLQKNFVTKVTFDISMTFMNSHNVSFKVHWKCKTLVTILTLVIFWPGMNRLEIKQYVGKIYYILFCIKIGEVTGSGKILYSHLNMKIKDRFITKCFTTVRTDVIFNLIVNHSNMSFETTFNEAFSTQITHYFISYALMNRLNMML